MADLKINDVDALTEYGIHMGEGFIDALETPPDLKERIVNSSRLEHGDRYVAIVDLETGTEQQPRLASRTLTLQFVIIGTGDTIAAKQASFKTYKAKFLALLQGTGYITIEVPEVSSNVYKLLCVAKSNTYSGNTARTLCKLSVKFVESNPADRATTNTSDGSQGKQQGV